MQKRQGAWSYSQSSVTMKNGRVFRDKNPFPSKLNIMSDDDKKARGLEDDNRPSRPGFPDRKFEV